MGGPANITVVRAGAKPSDVIAFDTGPGNMVIDALVVHHTGGKQRFDRGGAMARSGAVHARLLKAMLSDPYFTIKPPKSTGRERFGSEFVNGLIATGIALPDLIATATEFTVHSIVQAITKRTKDVIASGGGVHNLQIMRRLGDLRPGIDVKTTADFGVDPDAKEAIAFAVLAYEHARGLAGNLPRATGARRAVMLGKNSPA